LSLFTRRQSQGKQREAICFKKYKFIIKQDFLNTDSGQTRYLPAGTRPSEELIGPDRPFTNISQKWTSDSRISFTALAHPVCRIL